MRHWLEGATVEPVGDFDMSTLWTGSSRPNLELAERELRAGRISLRALTLSDGTLLVKSMSDQVATSTEIVYAFMEKIGTNRDSGWPVNSETYINNVLLTIDSDYLMGYLLECVDRTSGAMTFIAVALYHGRSKETGIFKHDFITYEPHCGTFFERTEAADPVIVGRWAVSVIYGMFESYEEEMHRQWEERKRKCAN